MRNLKAKLWVRYIILRGGAKVPLKLMNFRKQLAGLALTAVVIGAGASAPASAATTYLFDSVGDSYVINFNGFAGGPTIPGLTAQITYTLTGFSGNSATFSYDLDNTSSSPVTNSRVSTFGFNTDPNFTSVSNITGAIFPNSDNGNVPNIGQVEFCLTSSSNCAGGGSGGLDESAGHATGSFKLNFGSQPSAVTLSSVYVRYQSLTGAGQVNSAVGIPIEGGAVPEPATWGLMILGFGGAGAALRSKRRKAAAFA